MYWFL